MNYFTKKKGKKRVKHECWSESTSWLTFKGNLDALAAKAVSLIVTPADEFKTDMYVVNLEPNHIKHGIRMSPIDFGFVSSIQSYTLCVQP